MKILTSQEAAEILGMSADNVRMLERKGAIPAMKTQTGRRVFLESDIQKFAEVYRTRKAIAKK